MENRKSKIRTSHKTLKIPNAWDFLCYIKEAPFAKVLVSADLPKLCVKSCKDMEELNNTIVV